MVSGTSSLYCYFYIDFKPLCIRNAGFSPVFRRLGDIDPNIKPACSSRIPSFSSRTCSASFCTIHPVLARRTEKISKKYVKVAKVISIYVTIIGFIYLLDTFSLDDHPFASIMLLMFLIYVAFLLP